MTLPVYDQQSITLLHNLSLTNNVLHYYITCLWPTKYYITCLWLTMYYIITLPVSDQQSITLLHYLSLTNKVLHYLSLTNKVLHYLSLTNNILHYYITCLWQIQILENLNMSEFWANWSVANLCSLKRIKKLLYKNILVYLCLISLQFAWL
jgi:hypothetical protein